MNKKYYRKLSIAVLTLHLAVACTDKETGDSHTFEILIENGINVAMNTGGPRYNTELFNYKRILKLQQDNQVWESLLAYPQYYVRDERGLYFVVDLRPMRIVCFNSNGDYSHTIGNEGEGPGEFQWIEINQIREDTLYVFDYRLNRKSRFFTDGTLIDIRTIDFQRRVSDTMHVLRDFQERNQGGRLIIGTCYGRTDDFQVTGMYVTAFNQSGKECFSIETPLIRVGYNIRARGIQAGGTLPFAGKPVIVALQNGQFLRTTGENPEIDIFSNDGELVERYTIDLPPESSVPYERNIRRYFQEEVKNATSENSRNTSLALLEGFIIPEYLAFWSDVIVDDSGFLWLMYPDAVYGSDAGRSKCRVLSPEGEYLGDTEWPTSNARVSQGYLLTIETNERSGANDLIVYEINSRVSGLDYPDE